MPAMKFPAARIDPNPVLARIHELHPQILTHGKGCYVWDTRRNRYLDCHLAWGSVILGHANKQVVKAIQKQATLGTTIGGSSVLASSLHALVQQMVPNTGVLRFGKNGSDATLGAVRAARAHTGRNFILRCGYHGFHDWSLAGESHLGIPALNDQLVGAVEFNNVIHLESLAIQHQTDLAAIIIDPCVEELVSCAFLQKARNLADRFGAVLIFDEIISGFRIGRAGIQALHNVTPDLICLGKSIANGMPLSIITGSDALMQEFSRIWYGLTFEQETISMAAAVACLEFINEYDVPQRLQEKGEFLRTCYAEHADRIGVPSRLIGPPQRLTPVFQSNPNFGLASEQKLRFVEKLMQQGILICNVINLSFAHDPSALDHLGKSFQKALEYVAESRTVSGNIPPWLHFRSTIQVGNDPLESTIGSAISINVKVTNSGTRDWNISGDESPRVNLGFHLLTPGNDMLARDYHRQPMSRKWLIEPKTGEDIKVLLPGETVSFSCSVPAPSKPGLYCLELDCVSEGVSWFKDIGSETCSLPWNVISAECMSDTH
jgi:glutamate-1-semialdehyde 2,1-aminomutase